MNYDLKFYVVYSCLVFSECSMISSRFYIASVGWWLGDVVAGLGKALQKRGHLVEIVLPKYDCMQYDHIHDLRVRYFL